MMDIEYRKNEIFVENELKKVQKLSESVNEKGSRSCPDVEILE